MPLNFLHYLMLITLLVSLQSTAQQIPIRGLLAEQADARQGTTAIVHTHYGTAYGFFLSSQKEVLVSRHSLLTPQRTIADEIGVKYPQRPFNNFIESRSVPIAQDVEHDLVLLRIMDVRDAAAEGVPAVQVPAAIPPCAPLQQVHHRRHHAERRSYLRQARFTRRSTKASLLRTVAFSHNPRLHIVWDGPGAGSR